MTGARAIKEFERRNIKWQRIVPPMVRIAWRMGVNVSPPFYWSAAARVLFLFLPAGILTFAILVSVDAFWRQNMLSLWTYLLAGASMTAFLTAWMQATLWLYRQKLEAFPRWEQLQ